MQPDSTAVTDASAPTTVAGLRGCSNFKLRQANRRVSRLYDAIMWRQAGLKTSQYALLGHIAAMAPVRPADLAKAMGLEPSTLTRNLQPLRAQGWIQVQAGPDARSRCIVLTDAGRLKRDGSRAAWKEAQLAFNARLGTDRVARLHALLDECMALLGDETPSPSDSIA